MGGYVDLPGQPARSPSIREFQAGAPHVSSPAPPYLAKVEERGLTVVRAHLANAETLSTTTSLTVGVFHPKH
eukprot:15459077-Alexandrium_andersonii.AAC.1